MKKEKTILIVLGMHRSGTSVATRLFNLLGANPGEDLMLPASDNPTGFWEPLDIVAVHDELLQFLGSSWDDARPLPNKWWNRPDLGGVEEKLLELAKKHYSHIDQPIIKDPRLCRLLPLWKKIFKKLGWKYKCILVGRSPLEVAGSLSKRNNMPVNHSYLLWLRYIIESEKNSRGSQRTFLLYNQLFDDWRAVFRRCREDLDLHNLGFSESQEFEIDDLIDISLCNNKATIESIDSDHELSLFVADAFHGFEKIASAVLTEDELQAQYDSLSDQLTVSDNLYSSIWLPVFKQRDLEAANVVELKKQNNSMQADLEHYRGLDFAQKSQLEDLMTMVKSYAREEGRNSVMADEIDCLRKLYAADKDELDRQINQQATQIIEQKYQIKEKVSKLAQLESETAEKFKLGKAHLDHLESSVTAHKDRVTELECEIEKIKSSSSWRITLPLRAFKNILKSFIRLLLAPIIIIGRLIYHRLPVGQPNRQRLKSFAFKCFPVIFSNTEAYRNWKNWQQIPIVASENALIYKNRDLDVSVSVVIPVYNNWGYTQKCLDSIRGERPECKFEIIVVDDCSSDETSKNITQYPEVRYVKNDANSGFIESCNNGADVATGDYIFFLNNDTIVNHGWLDELVITFDNFPQAGLVGSKLVYPDGRLQEAGGIIWQDGSAWNFGRLDAPDKPEYNYLREVDYVSGAAIMVPRLLFEELGGFDRHYKPAYCEDSDLALKIRSKGLSVLYQPLSVITHYEGVSCGTDVASGIKSYQINNSRKLFERWKESLSSHRTNGIEPYLERDRKSDLRILIIDASTPEPDKDAGSVTAFHFMQSMVNDGHRVTFIPADNFAHLGHYTNDLQRIGVECLYGPYCNSVKEYLEMHGKHLDIVFLYRVTYASKYIKLVKTLCPDARIVFDTVDLHYLREQRQAEVENSSALRKQAEKTKALELSVMSQSDATIVLSETEKEILTEEMPDADIHVIPLILEIPGRKKLLQDRKGIVFIGGFRHTPNIDAVLFFINDIWPTIRQKCPDMEFTVIGSHPPDELLDLKADGINVVGFVEDISEYFDNTILSVVPLRFGAGIKGKIGTSLSYGVPVVGTAIATEGMGLEDRKNVLVAETAEEFTDAILKLSESEKLWQSLSDEGLAFVNDQYSLDAGNRRLLTLLHSQRPESNASF